MMEKANISIAMGNAVEEIKAMCKYETLSNEEHGVAHALYKYIINKKKNPNGFFFFISKYSMRFIEALLHFII